MAQHGSLPRWACVAFCARAAELLKPFVGEHLPRQFGFTYSNMIEAAKAAAADGRISERFSELEIENTQQAGRLQLHLRGMMPSDELPDDPELCRALSHAIVVASKAHECARDQNLSHVSLWAHDAYDFSRNAADGDTELIRQLAMSTDHYIRSRRQTDGITVPESDGRRTDGVESVYRAHGGSSGTEYFRLPNN